LEEAKQTNNDFAIRDAVAPIYAIRNFRNPFDAAMTVPGMGSQ
jgi:hypothetical protein